MKMGTSLSEMKKRENYQHRTRVLSCGRLEEKRRRGKSEVQGLYSHRKKLVPLSGSKVKDRKKERKILRTLLRKTHSKAERRIPRGVVSKSFTWENEEPLPEAPRGLRRQGRESPDPGPLRKWEKIQRAKDKPY